MQAEVGKQELRMLRERLTQCSAASQRHKEVLRRLGKKQQELQETVQQLPMEKCAVARCLERNGQELQQLERLVAQTKEHVQVASREAAASLEEAQKAGLFQGKAEGGTAAWELMKAAEAPGTDRGAGRGSVQSSTRRARSVELLQRMEENQQHLHDAIAVFNIKGQKHRAQMVAWLRKDKEDNEVLRQEIKKLEEALEEEEACQLQRKKEAEAPGTALPEVVEAQLEREMPARRRGFIYWLQTLCLLFMSLQLAVGFTLAAAVLYASWYDPELFYRLLLRVLPEDTYTSLACSLGKILPVRSEGLLPF